MPGLKFISACLLASLFSSCQNHKADIEGENQPNIIFIFSDDLSYGDLSCYGQENFTTPNLDKLALNGIRFNQAYAGASECAPSRGSLMTGMHMGHCRIRANSSARGQDHLVDDDITVAEVLKKAGYATGFIGKWGIGLPGTEGTPDRQGFDYAFGYYDQMRAHGYFPDFLMENGDTIVLPQNHGFNMDRVYKYNSRTVDKLDDVKNTYDETGKLIPDGVVDPEKASYSEDLFQEAALKFIKLNKANPFFLYYATQLPHGPCITPDLGDFKDKDWPLKNKEWAAMLSHLDRGIGNMLSLLDDLKILENTIIFFAGDNGYSQWGYFGRPAYDDDPVFKNRGPWPKGKFNSTLEGGMRVPFFVYWKDKIQAGETTHVVALYDFLATAADLAEIPEPQTDGISFLPLLSGKTDNQQKHDYLYWENGTHTPHAQSARIDNFWAFRPEPGAAIRLFDLDKDLQCLDDISGDQPEIIKRVMEIFSFAHSDSEWYRNPGESDEIWKAKKTMAEEEGSLQTSTRANTTLRRLP